jgi:hypothetical protein
MTMQHKFVDTIPDEVPNGWIFICIRYKTAVHKCICGCGNEVVTPISPTDWKLTFDGQTISLSPSIGNWNFECRSHYWIIKNEIRHSGKWTDKEVKEGREKDARKKRSFFAGLKAKRKPPHSP